MKKIDTQILSFNSLPLWEAARQREYRSLPYPARKLARRLGISHYEARLLANLAGWKEDE